MIKGQHIYPEELTPDPDVYEKIPGTDLSVPAKNLKFKHWTGEFGDDFGGKPVIDFKGKPMFLELAIQRMASSSGEWTAFWQEVYPPRLLGPYYYTDWKEDSPKEERRNQPSYSLIDLRKVSPFHADLICKMKRSNNDSYRGFWDVVAWKGQQTLHRIEME